MNIDKESRSIISPQRPSKSLYNGSTLFRPHQRRQKAVPLARKEVTLVFRDTDGILIVDQKVVVFLLEYLQTDFYVYMLRVLLKATW